MPSAAVAETVDEAEDVTHADDQGGLRYIMMNMQCRAVGSIVAKSGSEKSGYNLFELYSNYPNYTDPRLYNIQNFFSFFSYWP